MKSVGLIVTMIFLLNVNTFGQRIAYSDLTAISKKSTVTVFVFLATDCPISQKYLGELNNIADQYPPSRLSIIGFIPGKIKRGELKKFKEEYKIHFKIYSDQDYEWVRELKANVTPEVYVFNNFGLLKYKGAIDNWFYELGSHRQIISEHYLTDAIDAVMKGDVPTIKETEAVGCIVQVPTKKSK